MNKSVAAPQAPSQRIKILSSPITEIFICFGQEEFFEGSLEHDSSNFDVNSLFLETELNAPAEHHLTAILEKRKLLRSRSFLSQNRVAEQPEDKF